MTKKNIIIFFLLAVLGGCGKKLPTPSEKAGEQAGVPRRVLLELFTTTWCTNCPVADSAAWALAMESGTDITLVEYHFTVPGSADPFIFNQADLRAAFYGIDAPPVMVCDGLSLLGGAVEYERTYQDYKTAFSNRLLLKSPISINLSGQAQNGVIDYHLEITPQQNIIQTDLRLLLVVMEDSVTYNAPNGLDLHRFVARQIIPDYQGTSIALNYGTTFTKDGSIAPDSGWNMNRLHLAAFVQSYATKEVLQSARLSLSLPAYDFTLTAPETVKTVNKDSTAEFGFKIKNIGTVADSTYLSFPDSLSTLGVPPIFCDSAGYCYGPTKWTKKILPGDSLTNFVIHVSDSSFGYKTFVLALTSKNAPTVKRYLTFHIDVVLLRKDCKNTASPDK
ncbi:Omp28-related outer membrane protein [candidate division TA06 bacterium]|uniref:Omp28-related outer membrane protein n=1 Tax=candidate division TA06 bacterium TaxID=2250710 RepID=A0A933MKR5_UNCT6|nr:Omp28-related outer membrane protein [candidate division TA06 bacterium]